MDLIASREGNMNLHSLVWNQFQSPAYTDFLRYCWRTLDPGYSSRELITTSGRPMTTHQMQFTFHQAHRCDVEGCNNSVFVRCSHCGQRLCLHHFLERVCFHEISENDDGVDLTREDGLNAYEQFNMFDMNWEVQEERELDEMFFSSIHSVPSNSTNATNATTSTTTTTMTSPSAECWERLCVIDS